MPAFQQYFCFLISIFLVKCQQPERFYFFRFDDEQSSDWVKNYGDILDPTLSHAEILWQLSPNCPRYNAGLRLPGDKLCVHMWSDSYLSRVISTVGYHSIHLKIDVNPWELESNDWCYIQYRTASTAWVNTNIINGDDTEVLGFNVTIPDTMEYNNQSTFEVKIGINGDGGGDSCLYDYLEVIGIPYTQNPTTEPTKTPTMATSHPTNAPSSAPTSPTNMPTLDPTHAPTTAPINPPTFMPTEFPTRSPTADPSIMPIVSTYHDAIEQSTNTRYVNADPITPVSVMSDTRYVVMVAVLVLTFLIIIGFICIIIIAIKLKKKKKTMDAVKRVHPRDNPPANIIYAHDEPKIMKAPAVPLEKEGVNRLSHVLKVTGEGNGGLPEENMNEVHNTTGNDLEAANNVNIAEDEFIIDEDHETVRDDFVN